MSPPDCDSIMNSFKIMVVEMDKERAWDQSHRSSRVIALHIVKPGLVLCITYVPHTTPEVTLEYRVSEKVIPEKRVSKLALSIIGYVPPIN